MLQFCLIINNIFTLDEDFSSKKKGFPVQIQKKKQVQLNILTKAFEVGPDLPKSYCLAQCIAFKDLFVDDIKLTIVASKDKEIVTLNNLIEKSEEAKYKYIEKLQNEIKKLKKRIHIGITVDNDNNNNNSMTIIMTS
ncbi:hypothetical protein RFI_00520 [Reticulomyxa filosa]|uniref:Uncharacterized protein n=1 Tax=Reticulomyxa filosa TaxID=46433 RepID=X6PFS6_RETFI|nr:hypothetical protein RFI_00520 [Reticulomyxa filosa]|eukprot:ETO36542.1 hypothetical protein RFI_00520 [Reticulomyxa filosa]